MGCKERKGGGGGGGGSKLNIRGEIELERKIGKRKEGRGVTKLHAQKVDGCLLLEVISGYFFGMGFDFYICGWKKNIGVPLGNNNAGRINTF